MKNNASYPFKKSFFISFEGSEAVGKSTIIQKIADFLDDYGVDYIKTREPGGTELAEKIRALIFDNYLNPSAMTELLLMFAARRDHIEQIIRPALQNNKIILCDRYIDSSYIYQSLMNGVPIDIIDNLVKNFVMPTLPDVCFIIDADAEISYKRIQNRGIQNRNDNKSLDYLYQLRNYFLERSKNNLLYPYKIILNHNLDEAITQIIDYLKQEIFIS